MDNRRNTPLDPRAQRLRAAWMYYAHGLTQREVAARLGVSRSTVIRLLDGARARNEVRVWIDTDEAGCTALAVDLEAALGLERAVVVPGAAGAEGAARAVGLALGRVLSQGIPDGATIGCGWGRTLTASLGSFAPALSRDVRVVSLLGGTPEAVDANPVEYAWRLASALDARCHLFPAPAIVDSAETRRRLFGPCGLSRLQEIAGELDLAIVSVGDVGVAGTSLSTGLIPAAEIAELEAAGAVADVMCSFLDSAGRVVDHPVHDRVMSLGLDPVRAARRRILASGGAHRAGAIRAAVRALGPDTLVTDTHAAAAILADVSDRPASPL